MTDARNKPLMRSLGEFVGHVLKGIRSDPDRRTVTRHEVEEQQHEGVIMRRTTIEEVELGPAPREAEERRDEGVANE